MIGVFKKKTELPEYLSHYGMHRAPFSPAAEDDMYYSDPNRKQRLDLLLHLAQNTNELLLVTGDQGMGKTMFLSQFIKNTGEHWKVCHIEGHKMMSEEHFLQRVFIGFGIAHASVNKSSMFANLKKRLDSLLQQAIPVVLLVDDANQFSSKILGLILEIASIKNIKTGNSVRAILFSEPQIKIILAEPELSEKHRLIVRKIDLPALDKTHTGEYLHHRLSQAGMETGRFLTKSTIEKIYKQSSGIPAAINTAADKLLFETTPIIRRTSNVQAARTGKSGKYFVVLILLAIVASVIVFHKDIRNFFEKMDNQPAKTDPAPQSTVTEETVTPLKLPALESSAEAPDPMQALKDQLSEKTGQQDIQENQTTLTESQSNNIALSTESEPTDNTNSEISNESDIEKTSVSGVGQTPDTTAQPDPKSNTAITKPADAQASNGIKDKTWLLNQNPDHFTLQLVTGHKRNTIDNFISRYQLKPQQLNYFFSIRNEKQWHNLTYGIYTNRKAANAAIKKLPPQLSTIKPWIRQLSSIQSEIKQTP